MSRRAPRLLNLGCGDRFHPAWINLDHLPAAPGVMRADLSRPLPFPDAWCDACYASHVLEHLHRDAGARLLREIRRVLVPGGTVRLVVPDVERTARAYLELLDDAASVGGSPDPDHHRWLLAELFDQMTRDSPGGEMAPLLATRDASLRKFIAERVGAAAPADPAPQRGTPGTRPVPALLRGARIRVAGAMVRLVGGRELGEAFRASVFRASGEVHRAAYDRHALARALIAAGFPGPRRVAHDESAIPGFAGYGLDTEAGRPRKPDSLFMEATCPGGDR